MLAYSPQTTLHRKIIYNAFWICLDNFFRNIIHKMLRRPCWDKLHKNATQSILSKYVWDNIAQENYLCNVAQERWDMDLLEKPVF